jgi:hypothetical protein
MHTLFLRLYLFLILLLSGAISLAMRPLTFVKKESENQFYIPTVLLQRLSARPLLLENSPFDFVQLVPELQICVVSFVTPQSMSNLSVTSKALHEKFTLQTPGIWNIVTHSLSAISERLLPQLLVKAHLCAEMATQESDKLFYTTIKAKISSCYDLDTKRSEKKYPYQYLNARKSMQSFFPLEPLKMLCSPHFPLLFACYTGDQNIVTTLIQKNKILWNVGLADIFCVIIYHEKTNLIPLLCESYATQLESGFPCYEPDVMHLEPAVGFDWSNFFANIAVKNDKKKSFASIVIYYKKYLNIIDEDGVTYLDYFLKEYGYRTSLNYNKDYQLYADIIMQQGGIRKPATFDALLAGMIRRN